MSEQVKGTGALIKLYNIMSEAGWIAKNATVAYGQTNYAYTSEGQMLADLKPLFNKHRLILLPGEIKRFDKIEKRETKGSGTNVKESVSVLVDLIVSYYFYDVDTGDYVKVEMAGQGADSLDKAIYKALTGALKYVLRQSLLIGTGDDPEATDENGVATGTNVVQPPEHPYEVLRRIFSKNGVDINNVKVQNALSQYMQTNIDTEDTPELRQNYKKATVISKALKDGKTLDEAIDEFHRIMHDV